MSREQTLLNPELEARNRRLRWFLLGVAAFLVLGTIFYVSWYGSA